VQTPSAFRQATVGDFVGGLLFLRF
jgi:hypothetical protein